MIETATARGCSRKGGLPETLIGYAQGLHLIATAYADTPALYKLDGYQQVAGIADAAHVTRESLDELLGKDVEITGRFLSDMPKATDP